MSDGAVLTICTAVVTVVQILATVYLKGKVDLGNVLTKDVKDIAGSVQHSVLTGNILTVEAKEEASKAVANSAVAARNAATAATITDEHRVKSDQRIGEIANAVATIQAAVVPNGTGEAKPSSLAKDGC